MINVKIEWKNKSNSGGFQTSEAFLGKFCVGSVFRDGSVSCDDINKIKTELRLPGIKSSLGHFETTDIAKVKVEDAINYWVLRAFDGV
jgi:hypothetical protein